MRNRDTVILPWKPKIEKTNPEEFFIMPLAKPVKHGSTSLSQLPTQLYHTMEYLKPLYSLYHKNTMGSQYHEPITTITKLQSTYSMTKSRLTQHVVVISHQNLNPCFLFVGHFTCINRSFHVFGTKWKCNVKLVE